MLPGSPTSFQVRLDTAADMLTALSYFALPLELICFLRNYQSLIPKKYKPLIFMFALFIVLCGCTHAAHAYHAGITTMLVAKISTALISLVTAAAMLIVIPGFVTFLEYTKSLEESIRTRIVGKPVSKDWNAALNLATKVDPKKTEEPTPSPIVPDMVGKWKKMHTSTST